MELSKENCFEDLKRRIARENLPGRKRMFFSAETRKEIVELIAAGHSLTFLSGKIGVAEDTLSKWRRNQRRERPAPKKLKVVENFANEKTTERVLRMPTTDVQLPNGVLLKNIALNLENLALLKGL